MNRINGTCKRCGANFLWARTAKGRWMPVDPQPRPDGNLAIYRDHHGQLRARVVSVAEPMENYERPGMPHAATCVPTSQIGRTRDGAISLSDARRRRANSARRKP